MTQIKRQRIITALEAATQIRDRTAHLAAQPGALDCRVLADYVDLLQVLFDRVKPFRDLADAQALADAEMVAPPADIVAAIGAAQQAGLGVIQAYLTTLPPPAATFDFLAGRHVWAQAAKADRAALDAAMAALVAALDGVLSGV